MDGRSKYLIRAAIKKEIAVLDLAADFMRSNSASVWELARLSRQHTEALEAFDLVNGPPETFDRELIYDSINANIALTEKQIDAWGSDLNVVASRKDKLNKLRSTLREYKLSKE